MRNYKSGGSSIYSFSIFSVVVSKLNTSLDSFEIHTVSNDGNFSRRTASRFLLLVIQSLINEWYM